MLLKFKSFKAFGAFKFVFEMYITGKVINKIKSYFYRKSILLFIVKQLIYIT